MKNIIRFLLPALLLSGCSDDYYEELSGNYLYRGEGGDLNEILSHSPNRPEIYGRVLAYDYNRDFIVAYQQPSVYGYRSNIGFKLRQDRTKYPTNSAEERRISENIADSILRNDPYYKSIFVHQYNYWIISHKTGKLYGPLTEKEYLSKKEELKVPERLKLQEH